MKIQLTMLGFLKNPLRVFCVQVSHVVALLYTRSHPMEAGPARPRTATRPHHHPVLYSYFPSHAAPAATHIRHLRKNTRTYHHISKQNSLYFDRGTSVFSPILPFVLRTGVWAISRPA